MHESHERDNLCHFRGERERERERETENGMKIVPYGVASFYLQPFPRTWKSCRNSKILLTEMENDSQIVVVEGKREMYL